MSTILLMPIMLVIIAILAMVIMAKRFIRVPPHKVLVVWGGGNQFQEGKPFRIYTTGGRFIMPIIESFGFLDLSVRTFDMEIKGALTIERSMVDVNASISLGINPETTSMDLAASKLLGKTSEENDMLLRKSVQGDFRGICSTLFLEELRAGGAELMEKVHGIIIPKLAEFGVKVYSFAITGIVDHGPYERALGPEKELMLARKRIQELEKELIMLKDQCSVQSQEEL